MSLLTKIRNRLASQLKLATNAKGTMYLLVAGLLVVNVMFMVWYIFYGYQITFHSEPKGAE